ncbi:hypothetical protein ACFV9C_17770 [Kribbella sp. NPDC059898]
MQVHRRLGLLRAAAAAKSEVANAEEDEADVPDEDDGPEAAALVPS